AHLADVGFVDGQFDLHLRQVFGDGEQFRRLQAGGHGLARLDRTGQDHAVHRRTDDGAVEVDPRRLGRRRLLADLGLRGVDLRLGLVARGAGQVDVAPGHQLRGAQFGLALVVELGVAQAGLGLAQLRLGTGDLGVALLDLRLVGARVDAGDHLALLDLVVEVHQDLGDLAGDLAADGDRGNRAQGTGGRDRDADVAALHRRGPVT